MNGIKGNKFLYVIIAIIVGLIGLIGYNLLSKNNQNIEIVLIGAKEVELYQNEEYIEKGYNVLKDNKPYNINAKVTTNINNKQIGTYNVIYEVILDGKIVAQNKRIVKVIKNPLESVTLSLKGKSIVYILKDGIYKEEGVIVKNNDLDISDQVIITDNIDESKEGEYFVDYKVNLNGLEKSIQRIVKVIDLQIIHSTDASNKSIKLSVYSSEFSHIVLPDNSKVYEKDIKFSINKNGTYKFIVYVTEDLYKEYNVIVNNLAISKPTGTCTAIINDNSTTITVSASDMDGISKYQYNGSNYYDSTFIINYEVPNPTIRIYSKNSNYTDITCSSRRVFSNNMNNINLSSNLTSCNNDWSTFNNELRKLMNEAGLKSRNAVAIAAEYLAKFPYKVAYSWGGKYLEYGINPKWGCRTTVTKDVCTKSTGNMECILGLDCTGYTAWAFYQAGFDKSILRTHDQASGAWGNFIASKYKYSFKDNQHLISKIKPGDIVWTEGHVGIVLGTSATQLKVANMREGIRISYINTSNGRSVNGDKDFTHFVLFDEFFKMYGVNS